MADCKFCNYPNVSVENYPRDHSFRIGCPVCGHFDISLEALEDDFPRGISDRDKTLFSGYLRNHLETTERFLITGAVIARISELVAPYKNLTVLDRINNVLRYIGDKSSYLKERVTINIFNDYTLFFCMNHPELREILSYLTSRNFIIGEEGNATKKAALTVDGWAEYEKLRQINLDSRKVFVAMSFAPELDEIFNKAIFPACEECGFIANRVDKSEHNEKICDRIISEIKRSRFIVADFTGQKQGVYYEVGYAQGLGLPVIWTCKKDEIDDKKLHFDTRQYNYIAWTTVEELKKRLYDRIKATI